MVRPPLIGLAALAITAALAPAAPGQQPVRDGYPIPLEVTVRGAIVLLPLGDEGAIVYELIVANPAPRPLAIERLEVMSASRTLATWEGPALVARARRLPDAATADEAAVLVVPPGERFVIYGWVDPVNMRSAPDAIAHRLVARTADGSEVVRGTVNTAATPVTTRTTALASPVRGGRWLVTNGFANNTDHRRFLTASGGLFIPQRFGADFLKLGDDGNNADRGEPLTNEAFHGFDEPLYAVADGTIARVHAGLPDNAAGATPGPLGWRDVPGNHVVLEIAEGVFALYAHLREGSIAVREGERVRQGQLVGRIGNSGNSSAPHLHFHVTQAPEPNLSDGVPFVFASFDVLVEDYAFAPHQIPFRATGEHYSGSLPRRGWVVTFPN